MSIWYYRREKDGTKSLTALDVPFLVIFTIIGLGFAIFGSFLFGSPSRIIRLASYSILIGYVFLLVSKISLFAMGIYGSWGYSKMSKCFKMVYIAGYVLMVNGVLVILAVYKNT